MTQIRQFFQWSTVLFFGIAFLAMTFGQIIPIEFADWHDTHLFYGIVLTGLPVAVLFTLTWTLNGTQSIKTKVITVFSTMILSVLMLFVSFYLMFSYRFGAWINEEVIFKNKNDPEVIINKQLWDIGAFGYGGQRIVKLTPFLGIWNIVEEVDISKLDRSQWILVEEQPE